VPLDHVVDGAVTFRASSLQVVNRIAAGATGSDGECTDGARLHKGQLTRCRRFLGKGLEPSTRRDGGATTRDDSEVEQGVPIQHRRRARPFAPLQHGEFRRLWVAGAISDIGDAVGRIALTILVQRETGSAVLTGAVVAAFALPYLGPGQWLTAKLAHTDRRRLLIGADLVRALVFAAISLPIGVWPRLALLVVASLATPAFDATIGSLVPKSVPEGELSGAVGLRTATTEATFVVGFAVGGLLADVVSAPAVIAFNALTFVVSASILRNVRVGGAPPGALAGTRLADAARSLMDDLPTRRILVLVGLAFATALVPETLVATYVDEVFPNSEGITGALASVVAVGVIATTAVRRPADHHRLARHAAVIVTFAGLATAIAFAGPERVPIVVLAYLAVGPTLAVRVHAFTIISARVPDGLMAPAMSIASGVLMAAHVVAGLGGGTLAEIVGIDSACVVASVLTAISGAAVWLGLRQRAVVSSAARG
jgi:predicted MFS family arabinose efflux permease